MEQRQQVIINRLTRIMQHDKAVSLSVSYLHDIQNAYHLINFISHNGLDVDYVGFGEDSIHIALGFIHLVCYRDAIYCDNQCVMKFAAKKLLQSQFPTICLPIVTPSKYVLTLLENIHYLYGLLDISVTYQSHKILKSNENMKLLLTSDNSTLWDNKYDSLSSFINICENLDLQIYNRQQRDIHTSIEEF